MRIVLSFLFSMIANTALAHDSIVPHDHPHGLLPSLDAVLAIGLLAALAFVVFARVRGGGR
jgi:hypothetical protein